MIPTFPTRVLGQSSEPSAVLVNGFPSEHLHIFWGFPNMLTLIYITHIRSWRNVHNGSVGTYYYFKSWHCPRQCWVQYWTCLTQRCPRQCWVTTDVLYVQYIKCKIKNFYTPSFCIFLIYMYFNVFFFNLKQPNFNKGIQEKVRVTCSIWPIHICCCTLWKRNTLLCKDNAKLNCVKTYTFYK